MKKIVEKKGAGSRIDKFLKEGFFCNAEVTRGDVIRLIKDGKVLVNGKETKPSYALKLGDQVEILGDKIGEKKNDKVSPNPSIRLELLAENKDFIVINKPSGISVHPTDGQNNNTLVSGIIERFPEVAKVGEDPLRPGIVHRLDNETSGLLLVARNQRSFEELKRKFRDHEIEKEYLALVYGHVSPKRGIIEKPIARASSYRKQVIAGKKTKTRIRPARTDYEVVENRGAFDLIRAFPRSGRMHQIRVHLFSLGHPVVGDKLYRFKKYPPALGVSRHLLHARRLSFELFGEKYHFETGIPDDFNLTS